jgi:hypothetical protein
MGGGSDYELSTAGVWTDTTTTAARIPSCVQVTETTGAIWRLTGVKLEKGLIATPFKHESYSENLAKCQRYFASFGGYPDFNGDNNCPAGRIYSETYGTTASTITWWLPQVMRAIPTEELYNLAGHNGNAITDWSTKDRWRIYSVDTAWRAYNVRIGAEL